VNLAVKNRIPRLVKPVVAVMASSAGLIGEALSALESELGVIDFLGEIYHFDHSRYYQAEMGDELYKRFASFDRLRWPDFLARLKRRTAACEHLHRTSDGGRRINVDPGYWSDAKLVLASTKNYSHRIWIGRRVFAEVTLRVDRGRLAPLDWTYPDYKTVHAIEFFGMVRKRYLQQLSEFES
jgi:uncharacterized protein DUF4416